jgi:hypothetical protein
MNSSFSLSARAAARPIALLCVLAVSAAPTAAFNPQPDPPGSVMVGVVAWQTARLSVVNVPVHPHQRTLFPPGPCVVRLAIYDAAGDVLAILDGTSVPVGEAIHLDFEASRWLSRPGERLQIRAEVVLVGEPADLVRCDGSVKPALEIFQDRSGVTALVLPIEATYGGPDTL